MRFLTLFPEAENIHLIKDVGMLPYALHKEHHYHSTIACYKNGAYPYLASDLPGVNIIFIKRIFGSAFFDVTWFLLCYGAKFDVLQTYHFRFRSLLWLRIFKLLPGKKRSYLKLDANEKTLGYSLHGKLAKLNMLLLKSVDLVSAESKVIQQQLENRWKREVILIPNGFRRPVGEEILFKNKKQLILTVGRIGAPEKCSGLLLEAFARFSETFPSWGLELTGPVLPEFRVEFEDFLLKNPRLQHKIILSGSIENRNKLFEKYAEAKIFCLPSEREGFPLAMVEAASAGCFLISSNFLSASDLTDNERLGMIFTAGDVDSLTEKLKLAASNEVLMETTCPLVQQYAERNFAWKTIASRINEHLKQNRK